MTTKRRVLLRHLWVPFISLLLASACSPTATPTPFRPPTNEPPLIEPTLIIQPTKQPVTVQSTPLPTLPPTANPQDCISDLDFVDDVTLPDNTFVTYGAIMDKQWLVENNGTCNWNASYRLRYLGGALLGASEQAMLYPAKAGTQATLRILFTAPFTDGVYESAWQAYDPDGNPFGDPVYIRVTVAAP